MIRQIQRSLPQTNVFLITPPPVAEDMLTIYNARKNKAIALDRTNEVTRRYALACIDSARKLNVQVIDLWSGLEGDSDNRSKYLSDGLHLNEIGNMKLYEIIRDKIEIDTPSLSASILPMVRPHWSKMIEIEHKIS